MGSFENNIMAADGDNNGGDPLSLEDSTTALRNALNGSQQSSSQMLYMPRNRMLESIREQQIDESP